MKIMPLVNKIEKLPEDVKRWLISSIIGKKYGSYADLLTALNAQGYDISHAGLGRFAKKLTDQFNVVRLIRPNAPGDEKELRMKCLEIAKGVTPEKRIAAAEQYLAWVLNS